MQTEYAEIAKSLQLYFDGFYDGDVAALRRIFHPVCHLSHASEGALVHDDMETVYARVAGRVSPAKNGETRRDVILGIDVSSPVSALARVQIAIGARLFTDYLSFLRVDGEWRIIAKVYSWVELPAAARKQAAE
ncbi:MAG: nuclear transport factor 2 family protein [Reyranellaceae bacterium]